LKTLWLESVNVSSVDRNFDGHHTSWFRQTSDLFWWTP
jgi:hypothetical protein